MEVVLFDLLHAHGGAEPVGADTGEQHVAGLGHDEPSEADRVFDGAYARDGAGGSLTAVHDGGVELVLALGVHHGALAGVEARVVLHDADDGLDHVEPLVAGGERGAAGFKGFGQRRAVTRDVLGVGVTRNRPGAAVDRDGPPRGGATGFGIR
jgi:hypothetical protein